MGREGTVVSPNPPPILQFAGPLQPLPFPAEPPWARPGRGRGGRFTAGGLGGGEWHWGRLEQPEQKLLLQELRDDSEGDL